MLNKSRAESIGEAAMPEDISSDESPEHAPFTGYTFMEFPGMPPATSPGAVNPRFPTPSALPYPPIPETPIAFPVQRRARRRSWLLLIILVVLLSASVSSFLIIRYINRSTPDKTLDAFCSALQRGDYQSAYDQFSARLQRAISEATFAASLTQDRVIACTHGTTDDAGSSVTNDLRLVHASKGINNDIVTLTRESDDNWKIDDISRLSFSAQPLPALA